LASALTLLQPHGILCIRLKEKKAMPARHPTVSVTTDALVIRIPWNTVEITRGRTPQHKRRLTIADVLEIVEAGRLAHRLGKTRSIRSLKELLA
jgi:hypothetical protein